jgi:hypothetical protein
VSTDGPGRGAASNKFRRLESAEPGPVAISVEPAALPDPCAVEFVRFCYLRRRVSWPDLYDEMCLVAARGVFRGMTYEDLAEVGVSFTLYGIPPLVQLAHKVVAEERAHARGSLVGMGPGPERPIQPRPHLAPVAG